MFRTLMRKSVSLKVCATVLCGAVVYRQFGDENVRPLVASSGFNYSRRYYPASAEYPDVSKNRTIMGRNLTKTLYAKLRDLRTPNGYTIDNAIQPGVDNGLSFSFTGVFAGDEESYQVFKDLFDKIIFERHNYKADETHHNDLDAGKLLNGVFDDKYVLSIRIRTIRNLRGFCLPPFCTRGERRDIESVLVKALFNLNNKYSGLYSSIGDLSKDESDTLAQNSLSVERPFLPIEVSANIGRDWPDSRGVWQNLDGTLNALVNRQDHITISAINTGGNFQQTFAKFCDFVKNFENEIKDQKYELMHNRHLGYITTDPKDLGTALKLTVRIRLDKLGNDGRLAAVLKLYGLSHSFKRVTETQKSSDEEGEDKEPTNNTLEISSKVTLGKSEIEIAQSFINSINKLIETEKILEQGGTLDSILDE